MIKLEFPIYYTQEFKTKKDRKLLVGLNNYRNWHHYRGGLSENKGNCNG